jgi:hypothetical protein
MKIFVEEGRPPLNCQSEGCKHTVIRGETFCAEHSTDGPRIGSPLSGCEPDYEPELYNNDKPTQHSHNCYAYALDVRDGERIERCRKQNSCGFPQPGRKTSHPEFSELMGKLCSDVVARTMADLPGAYVLPYSARPRKGFRKIGVVVDPLNDFHYYRQDSNGWWSHKPGGRQVTNHDAVGAKIWAPHLCSRFYPQETESDGGLFYSCFCVYLAIPCGNSIRIGGTRRIGGRTRRIGGRIGRGVGRR